MAQIGSNFCQLTLEAMSEGGLKGKMIRQLDRNSGHSTPKHTKQYKLLYEVHHYHKGFTLSSNKECMVHIFLRHPLTIILFRAIMRLSATYNARNTLKVNEVDHVTAILCSTTVHFYRV